MKSKKYILAIAGVLSLMQCVASYAGTWEQDGQSWKYKKDNGNYAEYEWVQDNGDWYYCSRWGFMEKNTVIDGYYVGADGKMLSQDDKANPLYGEKVYGTCYMGVNSYVDCGAYYKAKVTLYDSSYFANDELNYAVGDKIWIEHKGAYGTVTYVSMGTNGDVVVEAKCGKDTYRFSKDSALCFPYEDEEQVLSRKIKDAEVMIPKNVTIISVKGYEENALFKVTLDTFLNENWSRLVPVFDGNVVRVFYDDYINYAS